MTAKLHTITPLDAKKVDAVNALWQPMYELAMVVSGDEQVAQTVTARTFLRAFKTHISTEMETEAFLIDELSKVLPLEICDPPICCDGRLVEIPANELHSALVRVPFIERAVFALQSCRGRSREHISEMLNIPIEAIPVLAANAMLRIRQHLMNPEL